MDKLENYYNSILEKVDQLVKDKKVDEALILLEDELDAPYMPKNFLEIFEEKHHFLEAEKNYFSGIRDLEGYSRERLLQEIFHKDSLDYFALSLYLEKFSNEIGEKELQLFQKIFLNQELKNEDKIFLMTSLNQFKIVHNFNFYNSNLNQVFQINSSEFLSIEEEPTFKETKELISKIAYKDISVFDISMILLTDIYNYFFPEKITFTATDLAKDIFSYVVYSLQGTSVPHGELFSVIEKIIKHKN